LKNSAAMGQASSAKGAFQHGDGFRDHAGCFDKAICRLEFLPSDTPAGKAYVKLTLREDGAPVIQFKEL
jgi:hypothetical protein